MRKWHERSISELSEPLAKAARQIGLQGADQLSVSVNDEGGIAVLFRTVDESDLAALSQGLVVGLVLKQESSPASMLQLHAVGKRFDALEFTLTDMDGVPVDEEEAEVQCFAVDDLVVAGTIAAVTVGIATAAVVVSLVVTKAAEVATDGNAGKGGEEEDNEDGQGEGGEDTSGGGASSGGAAGGGAN